MATSSTDRVFPVKSRGDLRGQMLADYRIALRTRVNPDTLQLFTEDDIAIITAPHSEAYIKADSLDAVLLLDQQRALWMSAQGDPQRSSSSTLQTLWSQMFDMPYLPASGGSGPVSAACPASTTFVGSTTLPDPTATYGTDPTGNRYQVLFTETSDVSGNPVTLQVACLSTGEATNLDVGTAITWQNAPDTVTAPASVTEKFTGGNESETDAQFLKRFLRRIRHRQAAGNRAQVRAWAEDAANNAVESGFVYPCAFHAGSTLVAITQKRGGVKGPAGRIPSVGTLATVTNYLVPPGSPVVPAPPHTVVLGVVGASVGIMVVSLSMPVGSPGGWADYQPWPTFVSVEARISSVTDQTHFRMRADEPPPVGVVPQLMVWDDSISRFEQLHVASITPVTSTSWDIVLSASPSKTLTLNDIISPWTELSSVIDTTIEAYFDSLGPGEVIDLDTDTRAGRAFRFPKPSEEYPQRAGTGLLTFLEDALGVTLADSELNEITLSTPPLPSDPLLGPRLLVAGRTGIYPL